MLDRLKFGGSYSKLTIQSRGGKKKVFKIGFLKSGTAGDPVPPYSSYYIYIYI
jgi:hypothetical protein